MANVYIVYAKENKDTAKMLVTLLSPQWEIWWDNLIVGRFRQVIERELPDSSCVVAINSAVAREKDTYAEELRLADKNNIKIIPIRLDESELPYPFGAYSYVDMHGWSGESDHSGLLELKSKLAIIVPPKVKPQRPGTIAGGKILSNIRLRNCMGFL